MIGTIILCVFGVMMAISIGLFIYEAKHAPLIDDSQPFLHDDYRELSDYADAFCKNCKFFDKTAMCLHEDNLGQITNGVEHKCKVNSLFKPE